jgi:hypothetical protein
MIQSKPAPVHHTPRKRWRCGIKLREDIIRPLQAHLKASPGERPFRFKDGGHFKHLLMRAKLAAISAVQKIAPLSSPPLPRRNRNFTSV